MDESFPTEDAFLSFVGKPGEESYQASGSGGEGDSP